MIPIPIEWWCLCAYAPWPKLRTLRVFILTDITVVCEFHS